MSETRHASLRAPLRALDVSSALVTVQARVSDRQRTLLVECDLRRPSLPARTTGIVVTGLKPGREHDYGYYSHEYYGER